MNTQTPLSWNRRKEQNTGTVPVSLLLLVRHKLLHRQGRDYSFLQCSHIILLFTSAKIRLRERKTKVFKKKFRQHRPILTITSTLTLTTQETTGLLFIIMEILRKHYKTTPKIARIPINRGIKNGVVFGVVFDQHYTKENPFIYRHRRRFWCSGVVF